MSPPYRLANFDIVYGQGIDKFAELMELGTEYSVLRKYGATVTYKEEKYKYEGFQKLLEDNPDLEEDIKQQIINRIKNIEPTPEDDGL
jgi:recombination protein RecA